MLKNMNKTQKVLVSIWVILTTLIYLSSQETVFMGGGRTALNWSTFIKAELVLTIPLLVLYRLWSSNTRGGDNGK